MKFPGTFRFSLKPDRVYERDVARRVVNGALRLVEPSCARICIYTFRTCSRGIIRLLLDRSTIVSGMRLRNSRGRALCCTSQLYIPALIFELRDLYRLICVDIELMSLSSFETLFTGHGLKNK